jgi:hypothetical protein
LRIVSLNLMGTFSELPLVVCAAMAQVRSRDKALHGQVTTTRTGRRGLAYLACQMAELPVARSTVILVDRQVSYLNGLFPMDPTSTG